MADAGMLHLRDTPAPADATAQDPLAANVEETDAGDEEDAVDQDNPPAGRHWREDKVGLVRTMHSAVSATDPCSNILLPH